MKFGSLFIGIDGRLRSGWRFAVFVAGFVALTAIFSWLASRMVVLFPAEHSRPVWFVASGITILAPALLMGWMCARVFERLPFSSLGAWFTDGWLRHLGRGLFFGAATLALAVIIPMIGGRLSFDPDKAEAASILRTLGWSLAIFAVSAASEEALFRGYPLQTFLRSNLTNFGIVFTSMLFASIHVGNPGADLLSWINTFLAGIWFGVAYLRTRDLWMPFGMHLAWNWMQGAILGIEVSGLTDITSAPLLKEVDRGPAWLTGGAYGIEAGVASTAALVISTLALYLFSARTTAKAPGA
jgi:membrane protease YdiL (CAAX protease family)